MCNNQISGSMSPQENKNLGIAGDAVVPMMTEEGMENKECPFICSCNKTKCKERRYGVFTTVAILIGFIFVFLASLITGWLCIAAITSISALIIQINLCWYIVEVYSAGHVSFDPMFKTEAEIKVWLSRRKSKGKLPFYNFTNINWHRSR